MSSIECSNKREWWEEKWYHDTPKASVKQKRQNAEDNHKFKERKPIMQKDTTEIPIEQEFNWSQYQKDEINSQIKKHGSKELAILNMAATIASLELDIDGAQSIITDIENWIKYNHNMGLEEVLDEEAERINYEI
jgi:hypothetical protein